MNHSIFKDIFKIENLNELPFQKMFICGMTTTLPLLFGVYYNHLFESVLASLLGLALTLNDHLGDYKIRAKHLAISAIALVIGYIIGSEINLLGDLKYFFFFILAFILGKIKNYNLEIERIFLFFFLNVITISGLNIPLPIIKVSINFIFINFLFYLALAYLFHKFDFKNASKTYSPKWKTFKSALKSTESNIFAVYLAIMTMSGYWLAYTLKLDRAYWIVGTILIVMIPDQRATYLKALQRFIGTVIGILIILLYLYYFPTNLYVFLCFILISNLLMPLLISFNFTLGNICISSYIICLLELTKSIHDNSVDLSLLRIEDIFLGGIIGAIGIFLREKTFLNFKKIAQKLKI